MIVMKFGGSSVADGERIRTAASLVRRRRDEEGGPSPVVVSAMGGVTDTLITAAQAASQGDGEQCRRTRTLLEDRHARAREHCASEGSERSQLRVEISDLLDWFQNLCRSIYTLGELTPRGLDVVSGLGERLCARIMAAALRDMGIESEAVEATDVVVTDQQFGNAVPLMEETASKVREHLLPLLERGVVPVVCGYAGATADGVPTTLGRGGSDYTATILARCLDADEVWLWTDVDGVMTADPRIVPEARTLPVVSYAEMAELSYFGAKVLHPRTIRPAVEASIPVWVKNTFNPDHPGTLVNGEGEPGSGVKGITAIRDLTIVTVEGRGMLGVPGVAGKVFSAVAAQSVSVLMISQSSSEQSICFVVRARDAERAILALNEAFALELIRRDIDRIWAQEEVAIIAVVGAGMRSTPGIAARVFGALAENGINAVSIAQGSSEYNLSVVVAAGAADGAVRAIHRHFELDSMGE
jgi:aspartokinase/homoserine dehydrogenase 1